MFQFTDGTTLTNREAAELVRREGELIPHRLRNERGQRCVSGVIMDYQGDDSEKDYDWTFHPWGSLMPMVDENNRFEGTPAERCEHMAVWLEELPGV